MKQNEVIDGLERQVGCYRRLAKLAETQHEFVQQGQTEQLLNVLQSRQEVLDQLAALERQIAPAKQAWQSYLAGLASGERNRAEGLLSETRQLLEEITTADRNDALVLQQRKLNVGRQINQASAARQINRSYAAAAYGSKSRGVDVQR
jgi:hypothetical protein